MKSRVNLVGVVTIELGTACISISLEGRFENLTSGGYAALDELEDAGWFLAGAAMQPIRESYEQLQRFTSGSDESAE